TFVQAILGGTNYFNQYIVYILGPVIGGALGAFAYDFLARPKAAAAESAPVEAAKAAASHR
ncbi:MAG: hypothetical protein ACXWP6_15750, partial [Ktedonobacterales bacterium]